VSDPWTDGLHRCEQCGEPIPPHRGDARRCTPCIWADDDIEPAEDFEEPEEDGECEACGGEGFVFCDDGKGGVIGVECPEC
jgi:hypothetical protein